MREEARRLIALVSLNCILIWKEQSMLSVVESGLNTLGNSVLEKRDRLKQKALALLIIALLNRT